MKAIVIGAGVVGLACARQMALSFPKLSIFVLEQHSVIGSETSSRNSGVIHSGLYYPGNSLKAAYCVTGRRKLYKYLEDRNISFEKCGKLIVSTDDKHESAIKLTSLLQQARKNGLVNDSECQLISGKGAMALEPELFCREALLCKETGIVDTHHYMQMLHADCEELGVDFVFQCDAQSVVIHPNNASPENGKFELETSQGPINTDILINCGGLYSPRFMKHIKGKDFSQDEHVPKHVYFAKGNYFRLASNKSPFDHLIYPIPSGDGGLGVHSTRDMTHQLRFGPDVEWLKRPSLHSSEVPESIVDEYAWDVKDWSVDIAGSYFNVDELRSESFYNEIRKYYPGLPDDSLVPDYAGVRPKLVGPNGGGRWGTDFVVQNHVKGLVNMLGIESPGLTSSLSLAEEVASSVQKYCV